MNKTMEGASLRSFTELNAWQKSRQVRKAISAMVKTWPSEEKFRLTDQIIRSSRGPCSHIAEGFGSFYEKENRRYCRIARGSLYETMDHLSTAYDDGYVEKSLLKAQWALVDEAIRVLNGYLRYLQKFTPNDRVSEPEAHYGEEFPIFVDPPADLFDDDVPSPQSDN
jgi:four helix bundle protein